MMNNLMNWRFPVCASMMTLVLQGAVGIIQARDFRPDLIPNGRKIDGRGCINCHTTFGGGGSRNAFGRDVEMHVTPNGSQRFWSEVFDLDSDGDGFTNGEELGDPEGLFGTRNYVPNPDFEPSNPGNANSVPQISNTAPEITSAPVTDAIIGLLYEYAASATDSENDAVAFEKVAGPEWLSVAADGRVSGIPPEEAAGDVEVTLRATDDGDPPMTDEQNYTLNVIAAFTGWRELNFNLPEENDLADPAVDGDNDQLPNLIEFGLRLDPKTADDFEFPQPAFNGEDRMTLELAIRDDAPGLTVQAEFSNSIDFTEPTLVEGEVSDPTPDDGMRTWLFTDPVNRSEAQARYLRLKFSQSAP